MSWRMTLHLYRTVLEGDLFFSYIDRGSHDFIGFVHSQEFSKGFSFSCANAPIALHLLSHMHFCLLTLASGMSQIDEIWCLPMMEGIWFRHRRKICQGLCLWRSYAAYCNARQQLMFEGFHSYYRRLLRAGLAHWKFLINCKKLKAHRIDCASRWRCIFLKASIWAGWRRFAQKSQTLKSKLSGNGRDGKMEFHVKWEY